MKCSLPLDELISYLSSRHVRFCGQANSLNQSTAEGQILRENTELLVKPLLTDGVCELNSGSVKKQLAIRAQLLKGLLT